MTFFVASPWQALAKMSTRTYFATLSDMAWLWSKSQGQLTPVPKISGPDFGLGDVTTAHRVVFLVGLVSSLADKRFWAMVPFAIGYGAVFVKVASYDLPNALPLLAVCPLSLSGGVAARLHVLAELPVPGSVCFLRSTHWTSISWRLPRSPRLVAHSVARPVWSS
jgi:hypothetical protein